MPVRPTGWKPVLPLIEDASVDNEDAAQRKKDANVRTKYANERNKHAVVNNTDAFQRGILATQGHNSAPQRMKRSSPGNEDAVRRIIDLDDSTTDPHASNAERTAQTADAGEEESDVKNLPRCPSTASGCCA